MLVPASACDTGRFAFAVLRVFVDRRLLDGWYAGLPDEVTPGDFEASGPEARS
jgi:hypothetical protein